MRAAVQGESQLQSIPNNTAIMVSFAARVALELSTMVDGNRTDLAPSVQTLIAETADVLERTGSTPLHRNGASTLYARQLRIVSQKTSSRRANENTGEWTGAQTNNTSFVPGPHQQQTTQDYQSGPSNNAATPFAASDPMAFSGMSNEEIVLAIDNADFGLDVSSIDLPFGDGANLDWLDWPT
jgi:hypothetical protein